VAKKSDPPTLALPRAVSDEIADAARRTHRSVAFIVARALAAGKDAAPQPLTGELSELALTSDDDDPPGALKAAKTADPSHLTAAWQLTRPRFQSWIAREEAAQAAERADDLDAGLRDASDVRAAPARLIELARSEYVRVRALVAVHPGAPPEALELLGRDRDRVVRQALDARR
jgi:hypothetical protein